MTTSARAVSSSATTARAVRASLSALLPLPCVASATERALPGRAAERVAGERAAHRALNGAGAPLGLVTRSDAGRLRWPRGYLGSTAHTDGIAVAVSGAAPPLTALGVDVERAGALATSDAVLVMAPDELEMLAQEPELAQELATCLWSAKEATFKAWCAALEDDLDGADPCEIVVRVQPRANPSSFDVGATGDLAARLDGCADSLSGRWATVGPLVLSLVWAAPAIARIG